MLFYIILTTNLQSEYCHLNFTAEQTGALRGKNDLTGSTARIRTTKKTQEAYESMFPVMQYQRRRGVGGRECKNWKVLLPLV